ncbi:DNA-deoxyinosine glycosylase [Texcoconibacillus texcoconensis]|uniref:TDG/mug DNA glycosylase family protein n=1 Tax=Texcoconibacillus texcoconensis TaxID=1095777 RepID=A0A840QQH6_9BACI|nr:TDG/mug DNA glycosylase family protein [Texcoconibacillus texcoconensis]
MSVVKSMPPIITEEARVLVLGSMPSEQSLKKQQYYGHPRNHFWPILSNIFEEDVGTEYEQRVFFLHRHHIALWDVFRMCEREGSLDSNIRNAQVNDVVSLLEQYPNIRLVACNGNKAYESFIRYLYKEVEGMVEVKKLPSTSPIPGKNVKTFEEKVEEWQIVRENVLKR